VERDAAVPADSSGGACAGLAMVDVVGWRATRATDDGLFVVYEKKAQPMAATRSRLMIVIKVKRKAGK